MNLRFLELIVADVSAHSMNVPHTHPESHLWIDSLILISIAVVSIALSYKWNRKKNDKLARKGVVIKHL